MLVIKKGVRFDVGYNAMAIAAIVCSEVYHEHGYPCRITSGTDGKHGKNSLHYSGLAIDLGIRDGNGELIKQEICRKIAADIRGRLGDAYDVVEEYDKIHLHVEYDPD